MSLEQLNLLLPAMLLTACRFAGIVAFAPVLGNGAIPRKVQLMIVLALTLGMTPRLHPIEHTTLGMFLAGGASELIFGIALGMCANLVFIAAQWAGEMIGQQMGFTLSGLMDPHTGTENSVVGELYLATAAVVFLLVNGHHALIRGVAASFETLPLLSISLNRNLLDVMVGLLQSATILSLQLAAPLLLTMLIVDFSLGVMTRIVPQMNVMAMGMSIRSAVGLIILLVLAAVTVNAFGSAMSGWMNSLTNLMPTAGGLHP
jgi:flagellar biosynthetic protein FliR